MEYAEIDFTKRISAYFAMRRISTYVSFNEIVASANRCRVYLNNNTWNNEGNHIFAREIYNFEFNFIILGFFSHVKSS